MGGSRELVAHFACNDPDNGLFAYRVSMIEIAGMELEFLGDWDRGQVFREDLTLLRFKLGRLWFPYKRSKEWYGNWCWNAYWMKRPAALRLLHHLRDSGKWHCTCGPSRLFYWFNSETA